MIPETTQVPLSIAAIPTPGFEAAARSGTEESPDMRLALVPWAPPGAGQEAEAVQGGTSPAWLTPFV